MIFKREGFFAQRHNDPRYLAAELLSTVYSDGEVDPELQDISGEQLKRGADETNGVTLNLHPRGFCEQQPSAFPDVSVCHTNTESYKNNQYSRRVLDTEH